MVVSISGTSQLNCIADIFELSTLFAFVVVLCRMKNKLAFVLLPSSYSESIPIALIPVKVKPSQPMSWFGDSPSDLVYRSQDCLCDS